MRIARALAAAALTLGLAATLTPAHADPTPPDSPNCVLGNVELSDYELTVGAAQEATIDVVATATGCEDVRYVYLEFVASVATSLYPSEADPSQWTGTLDVDPHFLVNDNAGKSPGLLYFDDGRVADSGVTLTLKRRTELQLFVPWTPRHGNTPVKKNKLFPVYADLYRADWEQTGYIVAGDTPIRLQSRPSGGKWKTIKTVRTSPGDNGGSATYYTKIKKATCFRWVYDGSSTLSADTSNTECVKIKK